jgi:hypothetical protein
MPGAGRSSKLYIYAGIAASCVMICIGIGAIAVGFDGRSTVRDDWRARTSSARPT